MKLRDLLESETSDIQYTCQASIGIESTSPSANSTNAWSMAMDDVVKYVEGKDGIKLISKRLGKYEAYVFLLLDNIDRLKEIQTSAKVKMPAIYRKVKKLKVPTTSTTVDPKDISGFQKWAYNQGYK